jgi:hypothetical protein
MSFGMRENGSLVFLRAGCVALVDSFCVVGFAVAFVFGLALELLDEVLEPELPGETFLGPSESVALVSELTTGFFLVSLSEDESLSDSEDDSESDDAGKGVFIGIEFVESESESELDVEDESLDDCPAFAAPELSTILSSSDVDSLAEDEDS